MLLILTVNTTKVFHTFGEGNADRALTHFSEPMENIPSESRVLNIDWDLFPALFSVRPDLLYARGMDPSYDYLEDPDSIPLFEAVRAPHEYTDWDTWLTEINQRMPSDYLTLWREGRRGVIETLNQHQALEYIGMSDHIIVYKILL